MPPSLIAVWNALPGPESTRSSFSSSVWTSSLAASVPSVELSAVPLGGQTVPVIWAPSPVESRSRRLRICPARVRPNGERPLDVGGVALPDQASARCPRTGSRTCGWVLVVDLEGGEPRAGRLREAGRVLAARQGPDVLQQGRVDRPGQLDPARRTGDPPPAGWPAARPGARLAASAVDLAARADPLSRPSRSAGSRSCGQTQAICLRAGIDLAYLVCWAGHVGQERIGVVEGRAERAQVGVDLGNQRVDAEGRQPGRLRRKLIVQCADWPGLSSPGDLLLPGDRAAAQRVRLAEVVRRARWRC